MKSWRQYVLAVLICLGAASCTDHIVQPKGDDDPVVIPPPPPKH